MTTASTTTSTGNAFPLLSISSSRALELCSNPPSFDGDTVFVCSYPKSGTTWTQNIVYQLVTGGRNPDFAHISHFSPFYEVDKTWDLGAGCVQSLYSDNHRALGKRIFNTHLVPEFMPEGPKFKYIYVVRNGKDVVVSFYHHLSNQVEGGGEWSCFKEFLVQWCNGDLPYGNWVDHLMCWFDAQTRGDTQILLLRYEDMVCDLAACLQKIVSHLQLPTTKDELDAILPQLSFQHMKMHKEQFQPISVGWKDGFEFLRKGEVGDGASLFGPEEEAIWQDMVTKKFPDGPPDWIVSFIQ